MNGENGLMLRVLSMEARADAKLGDSSASRATQASGPDPKFAKIQAEAERINQKVREVVMEQAKRNNQSDKAYVQMAAMSARMEELFKAKPPERKLVGYQTHHEWLVGTLPPRLGISERQAHYMGLMGSYLIPELGEKKMAELGSEKCKILAEVKKQRGKISADLLSYAEKDETSAKDLRRRALAKGAAGRAELPSHDELHKNGPWAEFTLEGPREWVKMVKLAIEVGRLQLGDAASDAEVLAFMTAATVVEMANEEKHAKAKVSGLLENFEELIPDENEAKADAGKAPEA